MSCLPSPTGSCMSFSFFSFPPFTPQHPDCGEKEPEPARSEDGLSENGAVWERFEAEAALRTSQTMRSLSNPNLPVNEPPTEEPSYEEDPPVGTEHVRRRRLPQVPSAQPPSPGSALKILFANISDEAQLKVLKQHLRRLCSGSSNLQDFVDGFTILVSIPKDQVKNCMDHLCSLYPITELYLGYAEITGRIYLLHGIAQIKLPDRNGCVDMARSIILHDQTSFSWYPKQIVQLLLQLAAIHPLHRQKIVEGFKSYLNRSGGHTTPEETLEHFDNMIEASRSPS